MKKLQLIATAVGLISCAGSAFADRFEEDNPAVVLNGSWNRQTDANASGGGYTVGSAAGSTVTFKFTGDNLTLYRRLDTDGGQVTVTVDGNAAGTITFYFPERRWQVPAVLDHLGAGAHTIVLTVGANTPGGSTGLNVYIDAFETPITFTPSADQLAMVAQANVYRAMLNFPPMQGVQAIHMAAQGHSDYNAVNQVFDHPEDPAKGSSPGAVYPGPPGIFVGASPGARMSYFGYDAGSGEVIFQGKGPAASVDGWMSTVYHRTPYTIYSNTNTGAGSSTVAPMTTMDFGAATAPPATRLVTSFPVDGQNNVPISWDGNEGPQPLPDKPKPWGYPISMHVDQPANPAKGTDTTANSGTLTDGAGKSVPIYWLDAKTDVNQGFLSGDDFFMIPQQPLQPGTTYTATMTGTDSQGNAFNKTLKYTTQAGTAITGIFASMQGFSYVIQWSTVGTVATTQVNYGLTTAYGTSATPQGGPPYLVSLNGLAGGTYHYQIVATDAQGNSSSTPDATFVIPNTPPATVISPSAQPSATSAFILWSTYGVVNTTQVQYGLDTTYGTTVQGQANPNQGANNYFVNLTPLTPNTTYHFIVSATDAQGNTLSSADQTFTTPAQ